MILRLICVLALAIVAVHAQYTIRPRPSRINTRQRNKPQYEPKDTEILLAYVMFRHGDRSPGPEEIETLPVLNLNSSVFFPYGYKGLTNVGKQHAYSVGEYLRKRYNGFLSDYYLPEEISIRTTDFTRTKMTVLTALAALYPPNRAQKWNSYLNWQPIPYDTRNVKEDDLSVYKSCPRYAGLKSKVYEIPEIKEKLKENEKFFNYLSEKTGHTFKSTTDMYFMNNLVHSLDNVGVKMPQWLEEARPKIKELTDLEFECEFYNNQLKSLAGGVVLGEFISSSNTIISGDKSQPKVHLLSAHETSVAAFMAAATVFTKPHQPKYGATFSLELYRNTTSNEYGVMAVYAAEPGGPGVTIPIPNCGGKDLCDFDTFLNLTKDIYVTRNEHQVQCSSS